MTSYPDGRERLELVDLLGRVRFAIEQITHHPNEIQQTLKVLGEVEKALAHRVRHVYLEKRIGKQIKDDAPCACPFEECHGFGVCINKAAIEVYLGEFNTPTKMCKTCQQNM